MKRDITQGPVHIAGLQVRSDGIALSHGLLRAPEGSTYSGTSVEHDLVRLHFGTRGDYGFHWPQIERTFHLVGGHCNIVYSPEFSLGVTNITAEVETFGVHLPRVRFLELADRDQPLMRTFCERMERGDACLLSPQWGGIDSALQVALSEIGHDLYTDRLRKRFVLSKCVELMVATAAACTRTMGLKERRILIRADREKVIAARDLVNACLSDPPSLTEVSMAVGLNEFKLKQGFKEMFGTTLFQYATAQRLHLARRMLQDKGRRVQEVAADLGYATPQHFSHAFRRMFGHVPSAARK